MGRTDPVRARRTRELPAQRRIMIVDDEALNVKLIQRQLQGAGFTDLLTTSDSRQVLDLLREHQPDVLLLDVVMPGMDGLEILRRIRTDEALDHLPVVMVTAATDHQTKTQALELGVTDFLAKPVDHTELLPRVRNALLLKSQFDQLRGWAEELEHKVQQRTTELEASRLELIYCLGRAAEFRDNETGRHVVRVGRYVGLIARRMNLDPATVTLLELTAPLHDMGKIGIPDAILLKPGKLTANELQQMRQHTVIGNQTLERGPDDEWQRLMEHTRVGSQIFQAGQSPLLQMAARIALTHHEKWDGTGYPLGLRGEEIPLEGRITAVADVFDALSSERPYKDAYPPDTCFAMMEAERGKHFDPRVLDACLGCRDHILEVQRQLRDP